MNRGKHIIISAAAALLFSGCRGSVQTAPQPETEEDAGFISEYTTYHSMAGTEERYYLFAPMDRYLYSIDKETMEASVVCGKAGCLHDGPDCLAYAGPGNPLSTVRVLNGEPYVIGQVGSEEYLMYISEDGSEKKPVYRFPESSVFNFAFAGEEVIFGMLEETEGGSGLHSRVVCAADWDSDSGEYSVIYRCRESEDVERLLVCGDGVIIVSYSSADGREKAGWYLPSAGSVQEDIIMGDHHICFCGNGKIYYYVMSDDGKETVYMKSNPDGSQPEWLSERETNGKILRQIMNDEHIFINDVNADILSVYRLDGQQEAELALEDAGSYFWYGIDGEYLYCSYSTPRDPAGKRVRIAIDSLLEGRFERSDLTD